MFEIINLFHLILVFLGVFLCSISEVTSIFPGQEAKVLEGMSSGKKKGTTTQWSQRC